MITLRTNGYTTDDLIHLKECLDIMECHRFKQVCHYRCEEPCTSCLYKNSCADLMRLKHHVEMLLATK